MTDSTKRDIRSQTANPAPDHHFKILSQKLDLSPDIPADMPFYKKARIARCGEWMAERLLTENGIEIVARNWRYGRHGEIDLIGRVDSQVLAFIEVKTRKYEIEYGIPTIGYSAITGIKQSRIKVAAIQYLQENDLRGILCRFDVVVVMYLEERLDQFLCDPVKHGPHVFHLPDAF
jgi:Holliday junction resolvase-like predicted endonuclease